MITQTIHLTDGRSYDADFVNPQSYTLTPETADFGSFVDRITLAKLGVFSVDQRFHRERRERTLAEQRQLGALYHYLGMSREAELDKIVAEMEAGLTGGVWARSSAEFAKRRDALDAWVRETVEDATRLTQSERDPFGGIDPALRAS